MARLPLGDKLSAVSTSIAKGVAAVLGAAALLRCSTDVDTPALPTILAALVVGILNGSLRGLSIHLDIRRNGAPPKD